MFAGVNYSSQVAALFRILETTYEEVLFSLTLLPFWLTFDAQYIRIRAIPGTRDVPALWRRSSLARLMFKPRFEPRVHLARWCPICIVEDIRQVGEPYWHRSHQLPNVFACLLHGCALQVCCLKCGATLEAHAKALVLLPRVKCSCGHMVTRDIRKVDMSPQYQRLLTISCESLKTHNIVWDYRQVRQYVRTVLGEHGVSSDRQYVSVMSQAYGAIVKGQRLVVPITSTCSFPLIFRSFESGLAAPECAAVLAALNIQLKSAIQSFPAVKIPCEVGRGVRSKKARRLTVQSARKDLRAFQLHQPGCSPATLGKQYWLLRFKDPKWLQSQFGIKVLVRIPSKLRDRREIASIIKSSSIPLDKRYVLTQRACFARAFVRDKDWLEAQIQWLKAERKRASKSIALQRWSDRARRLESALKSILRNEDRPRRINAGMLAARAALTLHQAAEVIRRTQRVRRLLQEANRGKVRRQIHWAVREMIARGLKLTHSGISKFSGLPTTTEVIQLMEQAISKVRVKDTKKP